MARKGHSWWLKPGYGHARCRGLRADSGERCKNMGTVEGLCGVHARLAGGKAASDISGWSRVRLEKEYTRLRAAVLIAIRENITEVVTEADDTDEETLALFFTTVAGCTEYARERKLLTGENVDGR